MFKNEENVLLRIPRIYLQVYFWLCASILVTNTINSEESDIGDW